MAFHFFEIEYFQNIQVITLKKLERSQGSEESNNNDKSPNQD